ncbi:MAG: acetyltransferase [Muribaculaceae bacterium]
MKDLVLVGGGGHCRSVIDVAESAGWNIIGVLDQPSELDKPVLSYKIIGDDNDISLYANKALFLVTVGQIQDPALRIKLHNKIVAAKGLFATLVAPTAHVSRYASIGVGSVILHNATINVGATVGVNCIINTQANIDHDASIGDFTHLSVGVKLAGGIKIGCRCFVGIGAVISHQISICDDVVIGAGAVVIKSITESGTYVGNPARKIK